MPMPKKNNLEDLLQSVGNVVEYFRNLSVDTFEFTGAASQFTNWRDEQLAVHETAIVLHQGHMRSYLSELYITGPDALRLLNYLGVNSFVNFKVNQAKQYIVCNPDGYLIADCILFYLEQNKLLLVGGLVMAEWIKFHCAKGQYNVQILNKDVVRRSDGTSKEQSYYQFQIQGPNAKSIVEKVTGAPFPDVKFFHLAEILIAGVRVRCLRHSMAGGPGLECWFPLEEKEAVLGAIIEAGREFCLRQMGTKAYPSETLESGWMGLPVPAIYSGEKMRAYREWLTTDSFEAMCSIAGSFVGRSIDDYYYTPYEMTYGQFVKFDHDFIGREALDHMAAQPHARKVTLRWNPDDVAKITASLGKPDELPYKYLELPYGGYGMVQCDRVSRNGKPVGRSADCGYSHYARAMLSLAVVDPDVQFGDEVMVTWGEENGGTRKLSVERHRQLDIRAIVCPAPYAREAREEYHATGWRSATFSVS